MSYSSQLTVADLATEYANKGAIVLDPNEAKEAGWETGQVLKIIGGKETHARMWPGPPGSDPGVVHMDETTRKNAGVGLDSNVKVSAVQAPEAVEVAVAPPEGMDLEGLQEFMMGMYNNRVLTAGDVLTANTSANTTVELTVASTEPAGPVVVASETNFKTGRADTPKIKLMEAPDELEKKMAPESEREIFRLKVAAMPRDRGGKGRVVVDPQVATEAGWETGQVLKILSDKRTHARMWPGPVEPGSGVIQLDGATRKNAGAGLGSHVDVSAARIKDAMKVTVSPTEEMALEGLQEFMMGMYNNRVLTAGDVLTAGTHLGTRIALTVTSTKPVSPVVVTAETEFKAGKAGTEVSHGVTYDDIGGMDEAIQRVREMVELPLRHPELFDTVGVEAPSGVLLYGPPGTGKTLLARAVANETNSHFVLMNGAEVHGESFGESEKNVRKVFDEASKNAPSIIFLDEIDAMAPKRDSAYNETEKRVVTQLLTLMDGLKSRGRVVVMAATNRPDSLDPALRRPGRLDREIEIGIPDAEGRRHILGIHVRGMPLDDLVDLDQLAKTTHGFVGADLKALTKEAAMGSLRRVVSDLDMDLGQIPAETLQAIRVTEEDFAVAMREVSPSAMREVLVQKPNVKWDDVGGLDELKEEIREAVEWPLNYPDVFERMDATPPRGVLLHGPPGTGKTLIAKALAGEIDSNFISIKGPEMLNAYVGESEKAVRDIFKKARQAAPCVLFFDEIDSIAPARSGGGGGAGSQVTDNMVAQMLTEMDGMEEMRDVFVVGATNRLDILDPALLRPGRFDRSVLVPLPDAEARAAILRIHTKKKPIGDIDYDKLAARTKGLSGAELRAVVSTATMNVMRDHVKYDMEPDEMVLTQEVMDDAVTDVLKSLKPQRQVMVQKPDVKWDDVGGLEDLKAEIREAVEWPLKYPDAFKIMDAKPPRGVMLYGPPGTGKTLLAKALAGEIECNFISVKGPEMLDMYVGESEKAVRDIFKKARKAAPCVLFFDEIDSIVPARGGLGSQVTDNVVAQMLTEMDGMEEMRDVFVVGATNRLDIIDPAILRPGRFDRGILVPLPDAEARSAILRIHTKKKPTSEIDFDQLAAMTEGMSGADLRAVVSAATMNVLRDHVHEDMDEDALVMTQQDLEDAIVEVSESMKNTQSPVPSSYV